MNERILEFARQSGGIDMTNHTAGGITTWVGTGTPEFLEKFAELIVRECVNIVNSLEQHEGQGDCSTAEYIKDHFGVES